VNSVGLIARVALLVGFAGAAYVGSQRALASWYVDDFYPKFTGSASGLVLGISRVSYGVSPGILEECLAEPGTPLAIENFAIAHLETDYGEVYLEAIREKLDPDTRNGAFVVGVNPAALSHYPAAGDDEPDDSRTRIAQMGTYTADPNLEYIRRFYGKALYKAFTHTGEDFRLSVPHPDGWIEMRREVPAYTMSDSAMTGWRKQNVDRMIRDIPLAEPSSHRMGSLGETLEFLRGHGRVWMIRMPVHPEVLALEDDYWPDFNDAMAELARSHGVEYFDYSREDDTFQTYDGSHLLGESARAFTRRLCDDLAAPG
jgi:hypothetical protein